MSSEWTLDTLRELLENKIAQVIAKHEADIALVNSRMDAAAEALRLKTAADDIHFDALNHENARVNTAQNRSLNIDVYAADQKAMDAWKTRIEGLVNTQGGRREGLGSVWAIGVQAVMAVGVIAAILFGLNTALNGTRALPVSNPVTYISPGANAPSGLIAPMPQH